MGPLTAILLGGLALETPSAKEITCAFPPMVGTEGQTIHVLILPQPATPNRVSIVLNDKLVVWGVVLLSKAMASVSRAMVLVGIVTLAHACLRLPEAEERRKLKEANRRLRQIKR